MSNKPEVWLRGPLEDISALLQPVAHALLQAREEVILLMTGFPDELLWEKPTGLASRGFHLQHLTGVIDRLFTYILNRQLDQQQLNALAAEGKPNENNCNAIILTELFNLQVERSIAQLRGETDGSTLTESRTVGRAQLSSTVIGLYVHAAEHTMQHVGQLLVTVKVITG